MEREGMWQRRAAIIFCAAALFVFVCFGLSYLVSIVLPFLLSFVISLPIKKLSRKISERTKLPYKLCSALGVILIFFGAGYLLFLLCNRAFSELSRLASTLSDENSELRKFILSAVDYIGNLSSHLPFLESFEGVWGGEGIGEKIDSFVIEAINKYVSELSSSLPRVLASVVLALPEIFVFLTVLILSCFYWCFEYDKISASLCRVLPERAKERLERLRSRLSSGVSHYIRAYMILLALTFSELFLGLNLLRVEYAFLISVIVALVDLLPILGVGSVLVPWAVVELVLKNYRLGCGLLILYGVILIVRQILEPRIVGKSMGVHPFLTIFAIYAGLKLFGAVGMILAPIILFIAKGLIEGETKNGLGH